MKNNLIFSFSLFLAFKQTKEHILFQAQPLKIINKKECCALYRVTVKICRGLKQFGTTWRVPNLFLQKSLHQRAQRKSLQTIKFLCK